MKQGPYDIEYEYLTNITTSKVPKIRVHVGTLVAMHLSFSFTHLNFELLTIFGSSDEKLSTRSILSRVA